MAKFVFTNVIITCDVFTPFAFIFSHVKHTLRSQHV